MSPIYLAYAALAVAVAFLATVRVLRPALGVVALVAGVALVQQSIGRAKPIWSELQCDVQDATVLGSQLRENDGAIFLWLQPTGCEPIAYRLPWSQQFAQQLQDAIDKAEREGGEPLRFRYEGSLDQREPKLYAPPQPALPLKPPGSAPMVVPENAAAREDAIILAQCPELMPYAKLALELTNAARQETRGRGLSQDGTATVLFIDGEGSTWSIVSVRPDGQACIFDHGTNFDLFGQSGRPA